MNKYVIGAKGKKKPEESKKDYKVMAAALKKGK